MKFLVDKTVDLSHLIENQFPQFVREDSSTFITFLKSYYESQELKNQPLDIAENLLEYYNVSYFRKSELVEKTKLSTDINTNVTTIDVSDTTGFPDKGYIQIGKEIVYYGSKTDTQFQNCVRGTSALILTSIPLSEVVLTTSIADDHFALDEVINIAFAYTNEFLRRIKSEIAVGIPENLVEELELSNFLSQIRSFYSAKGSLNSHRILFRILFNDKKIRFRLKNRGINATIKIVNFDGSIGNAQVTEGGSGYDNRTSGGVLINTPVIEIFGSGQGVNIANNTAVLSVANIDSNGGIVEGSTIDPNYTGITIDDAGSNYVGPITAFVRERDFGEEETVTSISGNGTGIVESWDFNTGELTLTNIIGFFTNTDELISDSGELARGFVKSFEFISQDPDIEFPKDYLFRSSESTYLGKKVARIEIIEGSLETINNDKILPPDYVTLLQKEDEIFGVKSNSTEASFISKIDSIGKPVYEIDIDINDDFNDIYLPSSTQLTHQFDHTDTVITVDDASGFPVTNGIVYIDGFKVEYSERSANQFFNCTTSDNGSKIIGTEVVAFGRYKTRKQYANNEYVEEGQERYLGDNLYISKTTGTTDSSASPTHIFGIKRIGRIEWEYIGDSKIDYFCTVFVGTPEIQATGDKGELEIVVDSARNLSIGQTIVGPKIADNAKIRAISGKKVTLSLPNTSKVDGSAIVSQAVARIIAVVDTVTIEKSGALFSEQIYEFDGSDHQDFEGIEYSSWNINSDHNLDTDNDYIGVTGIYDFTEQGTGHVYTSSSAIPPYTSGKNRTFTQVFDGYTNAFVTGINPLVPESLLVFRNAVLQELNTNYFLVNDVINFNTVPLSSENVYTRYFTNPSQVSKISVTQGGTFFDIVLNTSDTLTRDEIFIFVNGVLQVGSAFSYTDSNKTASFLNDVVTVGTDDILVYTIDSADILDPITTTSSLSYTLQNSGSNYTTATTDSVIVAINGVIQQPTTSYTISGSTITIAKENSGAQLTVIDCGSGLTTESLSTLSGINLDRNNYKLQKLVKRIPFPSSIINNNIVRKSKSLSPTDTSAAVGITIDGIQYNSVKGNFAYYGAVKSLTIGNAGDYQVAYDANGNFDKSGLPTLTLLKNGDESADITVPNGTIDIAASIQKVNFQLIESSILPNFTGFSAKPKIEVINNNPLVNGIRQNPAGFKDAVLDVGFAEGTIDNILIIDGGYGYTEAPTIRISGGGKFTTYDVPLKNSSNEDLIFVFTGPIISGSSSSDKIVLTNELGSKFTSNPTVTIDDGSQARISLVVSNGKVVTVQILDGGKNFFVEPILTVISKDSGSGAVLRPEISGGKIVDISVINSGSGYSIPPAVSIANNSKTGSISAELKKWTFNIAERFITGVDEFGGYVFDESTGDNYEIEEVPTGSSSSIKLKEAFTSTDIIVGMEVSNPLFSPGTFVAGVDVANKIVLLSKSEITPQKAFLLVGKKVTISQGDDRVRGDLSVSEVLSSSFPESRLKFQYLQLINTSKFETQYNITSSQHSKIVGWSYDGHPIYCKYGYTSALDNTSGISEQTSSYKLSGNRKNGPTIENYPLGSFIEDYEYINGHGTLDQFNGRFCVTPEFPNGAYCYFMVDEYPHVIGTQFFSDPDFYNIVQNRTNDQIPKRLIRKNDASNDHFPTEIKNLNKTLLRTAYTSTGSVDSVYIEKKGKNYRTGDYLLFNNDGTAGNGALAYVSSVESPPVTDAVVNNDKKEIEFTFSGPHNIIKNDVIFIDLFKETTTTEINLDLLSDIVEYIGSKQLYSVILERNKKYRIKFATSRSYNLSFDSLNFNPYHQKGIELNSTYFDVDPSNIPSKIFVHTDNSIFELSVVTSPLVGRYIVKESDVNKFTLPLKDTINSVTISSLDFSIRSKGATGPIKSINIVNGGAGYRSLPEVTTVTSDTGTGAILSANSNTIGSLKNIEYVSYGDQFYGSRNVRNYLNLPVTVKVKSNFEITDVEVVNRGQNYLLNPFHKVNGLSGNTNIEFKFSVGEVMNATVIDGGSGFDDKPTIELFSQNGGSGATFNVSIGRKNLNVGDTVSVASGAVAKILSVDTKSSTLELLVSSGEFKVDDTILSSDGKNYGVITDINDARAYTQSSAYGNISAKFAGSAGHISDDFQRMQDNIYYQDWSYSISNEKNTKDWRSEILENTHPSGFRLFGKSRIHSRKSILGRSQNIVRSAVTFKATISSLLDLNVGAPGCKKQILYINADPNQYKVYDILFGTQSEELGLIIEVGPNYLIVALRDGEFEINEFVINVTRLVPMGANSTLLKTIFSVNGIVQTPDLSYDVKGLNIVPNFTIYPGDELVSYRLTTPYTSIDLSGVNSNKQINLTVNEIPYVVTDSDKLIVSMNGVIQRNTNYSIVNNSTLQFNTNITDKPTFALYHPQLAAITFTGSVGTTFDLGFTPSDNCKLLIFFEGINQSHHLTDFTVSGSTITFPQSVNPSEIFGWQIDETVECEKLNVSNIISKQVKGKNLICNEAKNVTLKIQSDNVKKPNGFFELEKETIDGTLYLDGTTAHGFGSRFKYSNPEYSTSHVEVINDITSQFNGSTTTFDLTINATDPYVPVDGENSLMVTVNGIIVPENEYSVSGSQITFSIAPVVGVTCAIRDFVGSYVANDNTKRGAELDQFNVFNGTRTRFNLSDNGVPETVSNGTDLFTVKNNVLLRPDVHLNAVDSRPNVQLQVAAANKVTYTDVPVSSDVVKLMSFNRQLVPNNHRNWVLDRNEHFDSVRTTFTLLHSYDAECDDLVNEDPGVESLVVVRNGVYQYPTTDYDLITPVDPHNINTGSGSYRIQFVDPPRPTEDVFIMFHVNDANNFHDLTDGLSQTSSTVLSYTGNITNASTKVPFVYVDGVYQDQNSYTWDNAASTLTFTGTNLPTLATDQVEFHAKLGELRPQNVYGDILNANLVVLQRDNHNEVLVPTVNNTFTVTQRSGSTTISGTDVVNIVQRSSTLTIGTNHYRITNLNLNTLVMYDDPSNTFVAFDGVIQEPGVAYDHSGSGTASSTGIGNGEKYSAISIPMGVGYLAAIDIVEFGASTGRQRSVDEINQVYDGSRTKFRLLLDGIKYTNYTAFEDIIISKNNVILHPGVDYTLLNQGGISLLGCITFTVAPVPGDDIWMVGMYDNELITLTPVTSQVYNTSRALSAAEQESIIFVQNNHTKYGLGRGAEFTSTTQMNFDTTTTTSTPFAILTTTGKVLDYIHTPYDSSRTQFNLFLEEENFIPNGSFDNDAVVDPRNIFVTKNGSVLTPVVDYNVTGTIDSRIIFTSAPAPGDIIFIKTHGLVKQLDTITGSGVTSYNLTDSSSAYYPNALIGRPREFENQIVAVKNGLVLDPLRDYYVHDNVVRFTTAPTASDSIKLYDYMSKASDIAVESYSQQVEVGDSIFIPGESDRRQVTAVHSPTVMELNTPTGITSPSGLTATSTVSGGNLTSVNVTAGGTGYPRKMKFRTYGIGNSASANSFIDPIKGGEIKNTVVIDYKGHNLANTTLVPTYEAYVVRDTVLSSSDVHFGTKLTSDITTTSTTIPVAGTVMAPESTVSVTITSSSGNNAVLQPFVLGGKIVSVDIEVGGSGYEDTDSVLVTTNGGGQGAVLEVTLDVSGVITAVDVINGGVGYDSYKAFINNEAIEYTNHDSTNLKGVTRGIAGTTAATATTDTKVIFAG